MKWSYFAIAAFLVAAALVKQGVPVLPVVTGIAGVALWNLLRQRKPAAR